MLGCWSSRQKPDKAAVARKKELSPWSESEELG